jgi:16S rRNA (guanine966-N2)-methyltransferase
VPGGPFALLLLDPPYRLDAAEVTDLISALIACDLLESGAIVVYEHEVGRDISWPDDVHELAAKRYGSTAVDIAVYERGAGSS